MAGVAQAAGVPDYDSKLFETWLSKKLLVDYRERTTLQVIANSNHTEELKAGGASVTIVGYPTVTTQNYIKGGGVTFDYVEPATITLNIDQAKAWGFPITSIDRKQCAIPGFWKNVVEKCGYQMNRDIETDVYAAIVDDAVAANLGATAGAISGDIDLGTSGSPVALTPSTIVAQIFKAGTVLDEQNPPDDNYWMVASAKFCNVLNIALGKANELGDRTSTYRNGVWGAVDNFKILKSNNLPANAVLFGHPSSLCFYSQLQETKRESMENDFGEKWMGLNVYGYKVIKPEGFGTMYVSPEFA